MTIDKKEYQVIASYKFILCILVVFLHNKILDYFQLTGNQTKIYNFFVYYIPQLAVSSFMLLSGFLMFHGYDSKTVKGKIKRRLSKLIPAYLFWNVIAIPYTVVVIGYNRSFSSVQDILGGGVRHFNI